jgi:hypothetical protein
VRKDGITTELTESTKKSREKQREIVLLARAGSSYIVPRRAVFFSVCAP